MRERKDEHGDQAQFIKKTETKEEANPDRGYSLPKEKVVPPHFQI